MSRDPRDWQADMKRVESFKFAQTLCNGIQPMFHGQFKMPEPIEVALEYWLNEAKRLTADKARLTIDMHADANNYQVQAKEIGELRKQLKIANLAYEGLSEYCVTRGEYESMLQKLTVMTKAYREQKELVDGAKGKAEFWKMEYHAVLREFTEYRTLYPLEREDTK